MNDQLIKTAEISAEFQTLGITETTLLRFLRRYEEAIRPGREELETEVRASDDPAATMRAWIKARMVNPLLARFASEDPNVQFPLDEKNRKNLAKYNTNQQVVTERKIERAKEWSEVLEKDYLDYPEFVYTMLRDISDKFDHKTISPPPQVDTGALAGMLTHYMDTAEKSQGRFTKGGDENQDAELRQELADATKEKENAKANLDAVDGRRPPEGANEATTNAWLTERQGAQVAFDVATRREKLLTAKYSKFGENMFDLYIVYSFDQKKENEKQEAERRTIVGRWREVPRVGATNEEFPTEESKDNFLASIFRGKRICVKERWAYVTYASGGSLWVLMDADGRHGLMAIATDGNKIYHMNNADNVQPFEYTKEIRAWIDAHPEFDYTTIPEKSIGNEGISMNNWMARSENALVQLTDPKTFVNLALIGGGGERQQLYIAKIVSMSEAEFNRYVRSWFVQKLNERNILQVTSAINVLMKVQIKPYAAFRSVIDALGDFANDSPQVFPLYLEYVAERCERRPVFEQKAGMDAAKRAMLISSLARCSGSLTPALREEILKTEGVFDEYLGLNTPIPFTGVEVMQMMRQLIQNPEKALQLIMKMHRQGQNIDGVAPALVQVIRKNPKLSVTYAVYVRQGRFKEGEESIAMDRASTILYAGFLRSLARTSRGVLQGLPPKIAEAVSTLNEHDKGGY